MALSRTPAWSIMNPASRAGLALALSALFSGHLTAADADPLRLLEKMNRAVRSLDYEGRYVVHSDGRLDALYVVHRVDATGEKERVVSLTGKPSEIIRSDEAVACLMPGRDEPLNVGRRAGGRSFSPLAATDSRRLTQHYRFSLVGTDRVAGRDVHQVLVEPKDNLRFGYRVSIDRETGLPLSTAMLDSTMTPRSQVMFVDIKIGDRVTPIERDVSALQIATADPAEWSARKRLAPASWKFRELPAGFELNTHRRRAVDIGTADLEHYIFSDGLATVSVYVHEMLHADGGLAGVTRRGAANAIGRMLGNQEIVVVGAVPVRTLEIFANSIQSAQ